ncbi:MAG: FIST C-terminal domain-containing protein [Synergistaceae bacterium]|nr:FIST C-terminal domain-containing protein [Synergistaceae bacterium]
MLKFNSASVRIADSSRAVDECIAIMYGDREPEDGGLWIVNAVIGHKLDKIASAVRSRIPNAAVVGSSCGGVIGREGAGEAMTHMAVMSVNGPPEEYAWFGVDDFHAANARQKGIELAEGLRKKLPGASVIYLLSPGLDSCNDELVASFEEVFGGDVLIFGGASSDNYKALTTSQYTGDRASLWGTWAVGFADGTLKAAARATHGFNAFGTAMTVTKADHNQIIELDGQPAWETYSRRVGNLSDDDVRTLLVTGGLAFELPPELAADYGNKHILRLGLPREESGAIRLSVTVDEGVRLYLTTRDEELIFSEQKHALELLRGEIKERASCERCEPVAVFQTDCLLRGRTLFDKVMKDEIIAMMQNAFRNDGETPPWLGMYGFGEFCPLGGRNMFHTYTTSLLVLYR